MGAVTTLPTFLEKLCDRLSDRSGLAGVTVFTGPVDHLSIGEESVVFAVEETTAQFTYRTLPAIEVFEEYAVEGRVWIVAAGGGEEVIRASRDRAAELLGEVVEEVSECAKASSTQDASVHCRATLGVDDARVSSWTLTQFVIDGGRDTRISFTIDVKARFTPA